MTRPAGISTTPISLRIGSDDLAYLRLLHPSGWQTKVKELIHAYVDQCRADGEATLNELERRYPSAR